MLKKTSVLITVVLIIVAAFFLWQWNATRSIPDTRENELSVLPESTNNCVSSSIGRYYNFYNDSASEDILKILNTLKGKNNELGDYLDQGYVLKDACRYEDKNLLFFDFSTGLKKNYDKASDSELSGLGQRVLIGMSDEEYDNIDLYPTTLQDSFLCYIGDTCTTCGLDKFVDDKVLFQCLSSNDGYRHHMWYAYNIKTDKSTKVKEITEQWLYGGVVSPEEEKESYHKEEKVYNEDFLKLFKNKAANLKY